MKYYKIYNNMTRYKMFHTVLKFTATTKKQKYLKIFLKGLQSC